MPRGKKNDQPSSDATPPALRRGRGRPKGSGKPKPDVVAMPAGDNLRAVLQQAARELNDLDAQSRGINDKKKVVRGRIKGMIQMGEFEIARRYWNFDDDEERQKALADLKLAFQSLEIGEQGTLFQILDGQASRLQPPVVDTVAVARQGRAGGLQAYNDGVAAGEAGRNMADNPFKGGKHEAAWSKGWSEGQRKLAERSSLTNPAAAAAGVAPSDVEAAAYAEGADAFKAGLGRDACPHQGLRSGYWARGWEEARLANASPPAPTGASTEGYGP